MGASIASVGMAVGNTYIVGVGEEYEGSVFVDCFILFTGFTATIIIVAKIPRIAMIVRRIGEVKNIFIHLGHSFIQIHIRITPIG